MSLTFLSLSLINPTPYEPWCGVGMYPWNCLALDGIECVRGGRVSPRYIEIVTLVSSSIVICGFVIVVVCMSMIIYGACKKGDESDDQNWKSIKKALVQQSLMYIGAFLLLWIFRFMALFSPHPLMQFLRLITGNLQGLFTFIIFLYHKVHNLKRVESSLTVWKALYLIVIDPEHTPEIQVAGLSMISADNKRPDSEHKGDMLPSIEEGVDEASKDMHLSFGRSEEVSFMFDCSISRGLRKTPETGRRGLEGSQFSVSNSQDLDAFKLDSSGVTSDDGGSREIFNDSDISISHDASTIQARNW